LPDGTYNLSAWIQGGGGEKTLQLYLSDHGEEPLTVDVVNTGWLVWSTPTIANITIKGGKCTIGLKVVSEGGSWAFLDDVSLVKID
jgi:arabinogalactan endo-1,4-beta-galactosidase